jgi:hypothetical protein
LINVVATNGAVLWLAVWQHSEQLALATVFLSEKRCVIRINRHLSALVRLVRRYNE